MGHLFQGDFPHVEGKRRRSVDLCLHADLGRFYLASDHYKFPGSLDDGTRFGHVPVSIYGRSGTYQCGFHAFHFSCATGIPVDAETYHQRDHADWIEGIGVLCISSIVM